MKNKNKITKIKEKQNKLEKKEKEKKRNNIPSTWNWKNLKA